MEHKAVYICAALLVALLIAIIRLFRQEKIPTITVPTEGAQVTPELSGDKSHCHCSGILDGLVQHVVGMTLRACAGEACQDGKPKYDPEVHKQTSTSIPCYDPGSMVYLGRLPADSADQACAPT